ncbi:MAG: RNA-binding protein [Candidatus Altiarchaeales archaeon ex4484_43]|nr:MAG: RNA-binding protein [Candidatus Altiarchaeales archaeon ex4484_43]
MLYVQDGELVIPGQLIGKKIRHDINCFHEGDNVFSSIRGIVRVEDNRVRVIPSSGGYVPKEGDLVIGVITNILPGRWAVSIRSPYLCTLRGEEVTRDPLSVDLSRYFNVGDCISAKISMVDEVHSCHITGPWKLEGGIIIDIDPKRVPRVVGRKRSMLNIIKEKTGCKIVVGQNGWIWIKDKQTEFAIKTIKRIEREAQTHGLTDRITKMLDKELGIEL